MKKFAFLGRRQPHMSAVNLNLKSNSKKKEVAFEKTDFSFKKPPSFRDRLSLDMSSESDPGVGISSSLPSPQISADSITIQHGDGASDPIPVGRFDTSPRRKKNRPGFLPDNTLANISRNERVSESCLSGVPSLWKDTRAGQSPHRSVSTTTITQSSSGGSDGENSDDGDDGDEDEEEKKSTYRLSAADSQSTRELVFTELIEVKFILLISIFFFFFTLLFFLLILFISFFRQKNIIEIV